MSNPKDVVSRALRQQELRYRYEALGLDEEQSLALEACADDLARAYSITLEEAMARVMMYPRLDLPSPEPSPAALDRARGRRAAYRLFVGPSVKAVVRVIDILGKALNRGDA